MTMANSRRQFLRNSAALVALCAVGPAMGGCSSVRTLEHTYSDNRIRVARTEIGTSAQGIVDIESLEAPILISKVGVDEYKAVLMLCTHKGCDVQPTGAILTCPCHGSEFSTEGKVLSGPASENLFEFSIETDDKYLNIIIS